MIRAFNAFQIVTLFAAMPFILQWLHGATFVAASAAFWLAICVYVVLFIVSIIAMFELCEQTK